MVAARRARGVVDRRDLVHGEVIVAT